MKTATVHAACNPSDRKADGSVVIKLRIYFKGKSRHLPTTLTADPSDLTRAGKLRTGTLASRADELVADCRRSLAKLSPFTLDAWDVDDVVRWLRRDLGAADFRLDFLAWCDGFAASKPKTARGRYLNAIAALRRHLGAQSLDVNAVTAQMVDEFVAFVRRDVSANAARDYSFALRTMHNAAKARYNDEDAGVIVIPRSPFTKLKPERVIHHGQRNLGTELIQRIIDADPPRRAQRLALDAFVVSFALMGMNLADMYAAAPPRDGVLEYRRQKTAGRRADGALHRVPVPDCLAPFLERLERYAPEGHWLGLARRSKEAVTAAVNGALRRWAEREEIETFTFYAARHSFASIARSLGVEKATIDECLVHAGDLQLADVYIERDWRILWDAQEKVLAAFRWPVFASSGNGEN